MADEAKVRSFRVTDETANKFKAITEQLGANQQQTLARLIDLYEMQGAKTALPTDIAGRMDEMDTYLSGMSRIVLELADAYSNVKTDTRNLYAAQLNAKDSTIADLQEKVKDLQEALQTAEQDAEQRAREAEQAAQQEIADAKAELAVANKDLISLQKQVLDLQAQLLAVKSAEPVPNVITGGKPKTVKPKSTAAEK